ncbi:hypothetical protein [Streptomyces sp. NPDC002520]
MAASNTRTITLYASPDGEGDGCKKNKPCGLDAAQAAARDAMANNAAVTVLLADGIYRRTKTLQFGAADSGTPGHPVTWTAAPGAHPAISGGKRITHWTKVEGSDVWSAPVPTGTRTRQVYINGIDTPVAQASTASLQLSLSSWDKDGYHATGTTAASLLKLADGLTATQLHELESPSVVASVVMHPNLPGRTNS